MLQGASSARRVRTHRAVRALWTTAALRSIALVWPYAQPRRQAKYYLAVLNSESNLCGLIPPTVYLATRHGTAVESALMVPAREVCEAMRLRADVVCMLEQQWPMRSGEQRRQTGLLTQHLLRNLRCDAH